MMNLCNLITIYFNSETRTKSWTFTFHKLILLYFVCLQIHFNPNVYAQGTFSKFTGGIINGDKILVTNQSPYLISQDIIVERSSKLVIQPGVKLLFSPRIGVQVKGTLIAQVKNSCFYFLFFVFVFCFSFLNSFLNYVFTFSS